MIVDTNVLLAVLDSERERDRIALVLAELSMTATLYVNEIIFAELASRYSSADALRVDLDTFDIKVARLSLADCHRAGLAYRAYRKAGGERTAILPDFLIGAHAAGNGWPVVTRNRKGFASYFPEIEFIDPLDMAHD